MKKNQRVQATIRIDKTIKKRAKDKKINLTQFIEKSLQLYLDDGCPCPTCGQINSTDKILARVNGNFFKGMEN